MARSDIKIELSQDAYELFQATRIAICLAFKCKHNSAGICALKKVEITEDGRCEKYDPEGAG